MSETAKQLLDLIVVLSHKDRVAISDGLWETFDEETKDELSVENPMMDPEYREMLERRIRKAEEHPECLHDGPEVLRRVLEKLERESLVTTP